MQYRINGITLPDGISGFGRVLGTNFVGSLALITGALPAQFGLRTAGIIDIQTPSGNSLQQGGSVGIYGGSFGTLSPSFQYGGRKATPSILSPAAASPAILASKIRPIAITRSMTGPIRPISSVIRRLCLTHRHVLQRSLATSLVTFKFQTIRDKRHSSLHLGSAISIH